MFATKVQILDVCQRCKGGAYLPVEETSDWKGQPYVRHEPCPTCQGSGKETRWVELPEFLMLLEQCKCKHERTVSLGGFHLEGGIVWDDERLECSDCGKIL